MSMTDLAENPPAEERRAPQEPAVSGASLEDEFPELKTIAEGAHRTKAAIRIILKDYFSDTAIKTALTGKHVRHFADRAEAPAASGYHILAGSKEQPADTAQQPAIDGQALFQRYLDSGTANAEDVKDVLFAIRREANRLKNTANPKFKKLHNLASLTIYNFQQQRRKDIGI